MKSWKTKKLSVFCLLFSFKQNFKVTAGKENAMNIDEYYIKIIVLTYALTKRLNLSFDFVVCSVGSVGSIFLGLCSQFSGKSWVCTTTIGLSFWGLSLYRTHLIVSSEFCPSCASEMRYSRFRCSYCTWNVVQDTLKQQSRSFFHSSMVEEESDIGKCLIIFMSDSYWVNPCF